MKIAYLSTFYPFRGGITQFNHSLFNAFKNNHEIKAFTFTRQYPDLLFPGKTQLVTEEDAIEKIPALQILDTINPFSYVKTANKIKDFKPDLMIMKYWMPFFAPSLGYVAAQVKRSGSKVISILDNVVPHEKKFYDIPFSKYFLKRNSGFVVMSETVKNNLLALKAGARFVFHEHPLYDHFGSKMEQKEARNKLGIPQNKKVLLFFGFIRDYKGLDLLLEAMASLPDDYYLIIAGEVYGDDKKYHDLIDKLNLRTKTHINLRYIRDEEVPLFFSASDVNVLPYRSATQSGILSIAYHFDLPVLVTDVGSLKQTVESSRGGMIIPEANPEMIADKVREFFNSAREKEFVSAIQEFKKMNSWKNLAEAILAFSNEI
ncbi:MAG: glycosyltransferase [Bacteroidetes bacterium]|nr:glycosyltransferase [Bacteroidota bacterium]